MFNFVDSNTSFIMKKLSLIGLLVVIYSNVLIAQVPQAINYQAVARDNAGLEIVNTPITVRFSIGGAGVSSGTFDYQETHTTSTNDFGLFNVRMGQGTPTGPAISAINWNTQRFLLVEVNFGSGFEQMGVAQPFVTVPYAILAQDVVNKELPATASNNDVLSWNGSAWVATAPGSVSETTTTLVDNGDGTFTYTNELGNAITFDANIDDTDADITNEIQDLQLVGNILTITNNGSATPVDLSIYNELPATAVVGQVLTWNGTTWVAQNSGSGADNWGSQVVATDGTTITGTGVAGNPLVGFDGQYSSLTGTPTIPTQTSQLTNNSGFITTEVDGSVTNELQTISLAGSNLTLSNGGGTVSINDADSSPTNEIQNVTVSGNALNISGGGTGTTISTNAPSTNQVLTWNGSAWIAQNAGSGADNWGSQVVATDGTTITGTGVAGNPLVGFDGQYSSLIGTPTIPTQTSQLTNNSGFITTEVDGSVTNEIQNVSISGNALNISGGGTGTTISTNAPSTNQVLTWNGTAWVAQNAGSGADNWGSQVAVTDGTTISGNGTAGNPLLVAQPLPNTATTGQTITWNGTSWVASNVAVVPTYAAGTGVSITGTSPNFTINNTAPDQTVAISGTGATTVTGTYPNFSVASTDNQTLTKTGNALSISGGNSINISNTAPTTNQVLTWNGTNWIAATPASAPTYTAGTGVNINGSNVISNTAPDQTVVMTAGTGISITGTYPNFTVTNSSPNQVLTLTGAGGTSVSGTYPNLTVSSTDAQTLTIGGNVISISNGNSITIPSLPAGTSGQTLYHDGTNWVANSNLFHNGSNVAIGTTSPSAKFQVYENNTGAGAQQFITNPANSVNSSSALAFTNSVPGQGYMIGIDNTSGIFKISNSSTNLNAFNRIQIDPLGNVGIGNFVGVTSRLDVDGQITMRTGAVAGYVPVSNASGTMTWTDPSTLVSSGPWSKMGTSIYPTVLTDNVGIGTNSPVRKLQVENTTNVGNGEGNITALHNSSGLGSAFKAISNSTGQLTPSGTIYTSVNLAGYQSGTVAGNVDYGIYAKGENNSTRAGLFENSYHPNSYTSIGGNENFLIQHNTAFAGSSAQQINYTYSGTGLGVNAGLNMAITSTTATGNLNTHGIYLTGANNSTGANASTIGIGAYISGTNANGEKRAADFSSSGVGSTNIGLFADASGATTNWAGYFNQGNVHIANNVAIGSTTHNYSNSTSQVVSITETNGFPILEMNGYGVGTSSPATYVDHYKNDGTTNNHIVRLSAGTFGANNTGFYDISVANAGSMSRILTMNQGKVGVGTNSYSNLNDIFNVYENDAAVDGENGSIINVQNASGSYTTASTSEMAGIRFKVGSYVPNGMSKAAMFYQRNATYGRGDLIFAINNGANVNNVNVSDEVMRISNTTNTNAVTSAKATTASVGSFVNETTTGGRGITATASLNNSPASGTRYGVYATAWYGQASNYGVYGYGFGGTTSYGVYGQSGGATTNWAGYFAGNVNVTGTLSKGGGTFKIDHPLDPENKILYHSFVESPDMMNIYNGNITTDSSGFATVYLPEYFDVLNKDFRYQLTVIGSFAQAIVFKKVEGNVFIIQTNQPNIEVSWQVTGVRKDPWAEKNRVIPEVDKKPEDKGKYIHPLEYGVPIEKGVDFDPSTKQN